jgi:ADP-ribose pyrophosphatase
MARKNQQPGKSDSDKQEVVDVTPSLAEARQQAASDVLDASSGFTFDGDRSTSDHRSGEPRRFRLVLGGDDPRDASLEEHVRSEETVWTGRIFGVNRLHVGLPDGRDAVRDVVRHCGAVAIVALTKDGRICLVRQYRTALGRVTVEIPAGKLDPGEDPLDCANRELAEETGMRAEKMAYLTNIATSDGFTDEVIHLYMATGLTFAESSPDADEFINVDLVDLPELIDAVLDGRIEDAKTVVGALVCDAVAHRLTPDGE